jgi:hypothetical protein
MRRIPLGSTDVTITDYCLGTMTWGNQTPEADAHRQMDMALDAGIDIVDTAEMYPVNPVRAETVGVTEGSSAPGTRRTRGGGATTGSPPRSRARTALSCGWARTSPARPSPRRWTHRCAAADRPYRHLPAALAQPRQLPFPPELDL